MTVLVVTSKEANQIKESDEPVVVKGPDGEILGFFLPPRTPDEFDLAMITRIKQNRDKPRTYRTSEQVMERLRKLELEAGECAGK